MLSLNIPTNIIDEIKEQASKGLPLEICGILAGSEGRVEKLYKMQNIDQSNEHFTMEPAEQFAVVKDMRSNGFGMLAVYHSHPETPARPSQEDKRLAVMPNVFHVIISMQNIDEPVIKGFDIIDGNVTEIVINILEENNG